MLRRLSVENYALIDSLTLELDPHLNIITGETGAGKSILLGALSLLLGAKNDGSARKDAARNCTVEGTFDLAGRGMEPFFAEHDLDYAAETTLTRIITPAGKSRLFINDVPVSLAELRELGSRLIDIHSQHQNLILSSEEFRTQALDTLAGNGPLLEQYTAQYTRLTTLRRELAALRAAAEAGRRDEEWLRFQNEELTAAALREGEQAETEQELAVLENAESIGEAFTTLRNAFDADETGILAQLKQSENALGHLRAHYPAAGEYADRLHAVIEELKDINGGVTAASERLEADPSCGLCYTRTERCDQATGVRTPFPTECSTRFDRMVFRNPVDNCCAVARRELVARYYAEVRPEEHPEWLTDDQPMWLWCALHAGVCFVDAVTAVHRVLPASVSHSGLYRRRIAFVDSLCDIGLWMDARYHGGRCRRGLLRKRSSDALWVLSYHGGVGEYLARWWRDVRRTPWLLLCPEGYGLLVKKLLFRRNTDTR